MTNIPQTNKDVEDMLSTIGINNVDELFKIIPEKYRYDIESLELNDFQSEQEIDLDLSILSNSNLHAQNSICFLGGGSYDHYIPRIVDTLSSRSEFYTAYTPYQPEVSQGTLQYLYEFQSMLCQLSGMEIANASLYDCASSIAEACSMSIKSDKRNRILISDMVNPNYIEVVKTYFKERNVKIDIIKSSNGLINNNSIENIMSDDVACIVVQNPNYYGLIENIEKISAVKEESLLICVSDPISMSLLKSPGDSGCDVYVGEGQPLGNYMQLGGPYIGLFATKLKYARKMPGRIIGKTIDLDGKNGYVMTLQTREQHIRRERATSNICTNQGLLALRCTIYMALLGKQGLPGVAKLCYNNAQYAASAIEKMDNFALFEDNRSFIKEFVVKTKLSAKNIQREAIKRNILIDIPVNDLSDNLLLLAFTEKRSRNDIDKLIEYLLSCK